MTAHALLSASGSERWMACTPSARLEATLPEQKRATGSFNYSEEGTMAHTLADAELSLLYGHIKKAEHDKIIKEVKSTEYYSKEFHEYVTNYVLYVRSQIGDGDTPLFEQRVDFSDYVPEGFGTADVVILSKNKVRVIDLKFGKGIPVSAKDNSQLRLYALGAYCKFKEEFPDITEVEYTIVQPRLDSITTDKTTIDKLLDWAQYYVKPKAKRAWGGSGDFVPGDHCQFCRAKAQCRARSDFNNELAKLDFREPPLLSEDELTLVLERVGSLKTWANDVEEFALSRAVNEQVMPPGYTLGMTVTHRKISDHKLAEEVLIELGLSKSKIFEEPKLKSIAALEKLAPKGHVATALGNLIVRPAGSPKLVKIKDTTAEDFAS
jgi:hypothetical protein